MAQNEETPSEGAPEWMVSYADMITILMSFFAVMFSMAMSRDAKKDVPMMKSLQRQFGALSTTFQPPGAVQAAKVNDKAVSQPDSRKQSLVAESALASTAPSGDQATVGAVFYFDSGTNVLNEAQRQQLQSLAKVLNGKTGKIEILAHTVGRSREAEDKLGQNWILAHARCSSATRYLVESGIDPQRIRIGIAARFDPLQAGADWTRSKQDQSVEVFTLSDPTAEARAPSTDRARE